MTDGNPTDISGHFRNGRVLKGDIRGTLAACESVAEIDASTHIVPGWLPTAASPSACLVPHWPPEGL